MGGRERRRSREQSKDKEAAGKPQKAAATGPGKRWSMGLINGIRKSGDRKSGERRSGDRKSGGRRSKGDKGTGPTGGGAAASAELKKRCQTWAEGLNAGGLLEEWEGLEREKDAGRPASDFHKVTAKTRYSAIPCVEETRVKLPSPKDFIHANYVDLVKGRRWILTQGPLAETGADFWAMVWQEKCPAIIMLCQVREEGRDKCLQYYPEKKNESKNFTLGPGKELTVTADTVQKDPGFVKDQQVTMTGLKLKLQGKVQLVLHLQYTTWPDQKVPSSPDAMIPFLEKMESHVEEQVKKKRFTSANPVLVHCSAGIGRSGTLVALHGLWRSLLAEGAQAPASDKNTDKTTGDKTDKSSEPTGGRGVPSLPGLLSTLRRQRHGAVQTLHQYFFIVQALIAELKRQRFLPADHQPPILP